MVEGKGTQEKSAIISEMEKYACSVVNTGKRVNTSNIFKWK